MTYNETVMMIFKTKVKSDKGLLDKNVANWISSYSAFKSSNGVALHEVTIL